VAYADINNDGEITNEDGPTWVAEYQSSLWIERTRGMERFRLEPIDLRSCRFKVVDFVDITLRSSYGMLNKSVEC